MRKPVIVMACALAFTLAVVLLASLATDACASEFRRVDDRPLIETPQQVREARLTGRCAVRFGGELFVIENVPKEYVDWSSWRVRME